MCDIVQDWNDNTEIIKQYYKKKIVESEIKVQYYLNGDNKFGSHIMLSGE